MVGDSDSTAGIPLGLGKATSTLVNEKKKEKKNEKKNGKIDLILNSLDLGIRRLGNNPVVVPFVL